MKLIVFTIYFMFIVLNIFSLGNKEKMSNNGNSSIENVVPGNSGNQVDIETRSTTMITGNVQIYGNEPHTFVGIIDKNGVEYAVYPVSQEEELRKLQGHLIEFTVVLLDKAQGSRGMSLKGGTVTPVSWKIIQ